MGLCLALLLSGALVAAPDSDSSRTPPRTIDELQARIGEILQDNHIPGLGLALVARDSTLWVGGLGMADVASGRAATAQTLFRIGSTSKAFTALLILMLQEEGALRLDDPLRRHVPEIRLENPWEATDPVRIAHALEHTTGFDEWSGKENGSNDPTPLTLRQGLDLNPAARVSRWRPGTRVAYTNHGPALAAYVVERVDGKPFEEVVQERVFDRLGMHTATFREPDTARVSMATLYRGDGRTPLPYWHLSLRPAGALNASAADMAAYLRFLLRRGAVGGRQLLTPASIDRLERSEHSLGARAGLPIGYGLAMARYVDGGFVWTGHDGGVHGGLTVMAYLPEHGVGFAFMTNAEQGKATREISRLVRAFLTRELPRPTPPPAGAMPAELRTRVAGWYRQDNSRAEVRHFYERITSLTRVTSSDSALVLRPVLAPAARYLPVARGTFRQADEPVATLALLDDAPNGRPLAIERMRYLLPTSLVQIPTIVALAELTFAGASLAAVTVALLALPMGLARWILGLILARPAPVSHARTLWGFTSVTAVVLVLTLAARSGFFHPLGMGRPGPYSMAAYVLVILLVGLTVTTGVLALRHAPSSGHRRSLCVARGVAVLNVVAAAYLLYWSIVGWHLWA